MSKINFVTAQFGNEIGLPVSTSAGECLSIRTKGLMVRFVQNLVSQKAKNPNHHFFFLQFFSIECFVILS